MRPISVIAFLLAAACPLPAYYHFIHYLAGGNAPEKFDLGALNSHTVMVLVSENGPSAYSQTDSFNSVVNQIRQATRIWDGVQSSALRVRFGGLENTAVPRNIPGVDCVFEDLPPGLLGYGGPTSTDAPVTAADGSQFVPITRSAMHLNLNLTIAPGPSYAESFFTTAVHEMGHALGLQHTFTSAAMSTATTRATNLTHPLGADDIAGISLLYPNAQSTQFGSISGTISINGKGAHLESVVAIRAGGDAISGMTNPDGSYVITGVPPGTYYVYAHTLPPDANIYGPWDANGNVVAASGPANTLFYPGTPHVAAAQTVTVAAGQTVSGIDISLSPRADVEIYDVGVYGFFNGGNATKPADVNVNNGSAQVAVSGVGIGSNGQAPWLGVEFLGGNIFLQAHGIQPYTASGYTYVGLNVGFSSSAQTGPQHLVFTTPDYVYVLPAAMNLTASDPPAVSSASANPDGSVTVTGTNWSANTLFYFDSLPATVNSLDPASGTANLTPPPGASGQMATISAYNADGQNSAMAPWGAPVTFQFPATAAPAIASISPASLPAGSEAKVDITVSGMSLVSGAAAVGFGTPDILVRNVFVVSPTHVVADVSVIGASAQTTSDVSVISGFQIATAASGFQVTPRVSSLPVVAPILVNGVWGLNGSYAGAIVSVYGLNMAAPNSTPVLTVGGEPVAIQYASAGQINFVIPANLPAGPTELQLNTGAASAYPVEVNIDSQPAAIEAVQNSAGGYVYAGHPAVIGDTLIVSLNNFAPANATISPDRAQVSIGGVMRAATKVVAATPTDFQVFFPLESTDTVGGAVTLIVYLDGRSSYPAQIPIAAAPAN